MEAYFNNLGFNHHMSTSYNSIEIVEYWCNVETHVTVKLYIGKNEFELVTTDRMIQSTTGVCSFPNKNIPIFIKQISCHAGQV